MKTTRKLSGILCLLLLAQGLFAQGTLKGIISGEDEPDGLIGATVQVGDKGTTTEYDGSYELSLPAGTHTVTINYTGYATHTETFTLADGETKELSLALKLEANILQEAVVTTGKFEKPLGEVTVSMEVIKPALAESTNSTSADEVLARVPGVTIIDGQANIRGGSGFSYGAGSRVLLLVDDIPILAGDAGFPNWSDVPIENISQMEVVKGAASALYGSSALNGIINIRTAYAKNEPETQFTMYAETYYRPRDTLKWWWRPDNIPTPMKVGASIVHRQKFGKFDWVFGSTGYLDYRYIQNARDNKIRLTNKLRYRVNEKFNFGAYINLNAGNSNTVFLFKDKDAGAYVGDLENMTSSKTVRFNVDPFLTAYDKSGNKHRYLGRWFRVRNDNLNNQGNFSDLVYNEYQFQRNFEDIDLVFTTGVVNTTTFISGTLYGDTTYTAANLAYYAQADKKFHFSKTADGEPNTERNVLNISGGFRYEYNRLSAPDRVDAGSRPVLRLGLNYKVAPYTYLRASWGQGYRYPTVAERYISTQVAGLNILPNPSLESETGWSTELGLKQGFQVGKFQGFADLSVFWSEYQDMMEFNLFVAPGEIGFKSQNIGNTRIPGMELSVAGKTPDDSILPTTFLLGYTYISPTFKEFEDIDETLVLSGEISQADLTEAQINDYNSTADINYLKYRTAHTFKFDVESKIKMFSFGVTLNGASKMVAVDRILDNILNLDFNNTSEPYAILGLRTAYHVNKNTRISVVLKNVTNKEYAARPGQLQPPMSFSLRVDAKF